VALDRQFTELLYVQEERSADFEFIPEKNLLDIPTLETSELMGYRMGKKFDNGIIFFFPTDRNNSTDKDFLEKI